MRINESIQLLPYRYGWEIRTERTSEKGKVSYDSTYWPSLERACMKLLDTFSKEADSLEEIVKILKETREQLKEILSENNSREVNQ